MFVDPSLRICFINAVDYLFSPIAFTTKPLLTIFLVSIILGLSTTLVRHFYVDWLKFAKAQKIFTAYQKELRSAMLSKNFYKLKKLSEIRAEITQQHTSAMMSSMIPMGITLLIALPIFLWLRWRFIPNLLTEEIAIAGFIKINLLAKGPIIGLFEWWIIALIFMGLPLGIIFYKVLRVIPYRKLLR
jgi:uncharacterized membrane protein (DUF106 family)